MTVISTKQTTLFENVPEYPESVEKNSFYCKNFRKIILETP